MKQLEKLLEYQKKITDSQYTINLLMWELMINAPKDSQNDLLSLISNYESKLFELQISDNYGKLLSDSIKSEEFIELSEEEQRYIYNLLKHYNENINVPVKFYVEFSELKNQTNLVWKEAKENNCYSMFKPYLNKIINMTKEYYRYIDKTSSNLYDVMLNNYETGVTSELIDQLFDEIKIAILPLIPKKNKEEIKLEIKYTEEELMKCAKYLLNYIGFDLNKGSLGIYPHGYTAKMNANDIRIAFRYTTDPIDFVTTIIHEGGHGIFEQNISQNLSRYENITIDNLYALHESQSRFYENILGRNKNFWVPIYDDIKMLLHLDLNLDEFIKLLNTPKCNPIRVDSDELTYCMHIILRYEIEKDLFNDNITVEDIPKKWNEKMAKYLNIDIENDNQGLMQDVHWSQGSFGYFPSYLMGSIYDGMFLEKIGHDLENIDDLLKKGKIKKITDYLINNIHVNGGAYTSIEIIEKMMNKGITAKPLINYFEKKYNK